MARQQVRDRIPVQMPPEAVVANKTGNWEGAAHDVAIVYGPRATFVIALLSDGITDIDALYSAMSTAARNVYDLVNDPAFASSAEPPLPRNLVATYVTPVRLPTGGVNASAPSSGSGSGSATQQRPNVSAPPTVGPARPTAPPPQPADRPRAIQQTVAPDAAPAAAPTAAPARPTTAPLAPKPTAKPAERPAERPAEKPAEKPVFAPGATPAVKPAPPSIFSLPTPAP